MRRTTGRVAIVLIALATTTVGMLGVISYARDYDLHRGFGSVVPFRRAGTGRLLKVEFHSAALGRTADYLVYLPPRYSAAQRYPVYYLLHGMPGQPRVFVNIANMDVRLDNQLSIGRARPMILVYPDGRIGGSTFSDSEWADTPSGDFENYVIEVMESVDRHFATLPDRRDRVIAGFSAGGYGAMNIALHHLADFANVEVWSGYFIQTRTGPFAHADAAAMAYNSPLDEVTHLTHELSVDPLRAYLFSGRDDSSSPQMAPMARALRARGASVATRIYPGGHDWSVWYPRLNAMLDLASWDIGHPLGRASGERRHAAWGPRSPFVALAVGRGRAPAWGPRHPFVALSTAIRPPSAAGVVARPHRRPRRRRRGRRLIEVLLLALVSAALINLGFVAQHRGRGRELAAGHASLLRALRNRWWLGGQALGWLGFAGQIVALALAPLTLVQAFAAGSLAISVPVAARIMGQRVGRVQLAAVAVVAVSLASLPVGLGHHHGHLQPGALLVAGLVTALAAIGFALRGRTTLQAIASGALYGLADAAIKADAFGLHHHGVRALISGWTILAALSTFGGFLAFQAALRGRDAVQPLSLMNAFTAVTAVALGVGGFGETLGAGAPASIAHLIAIALVLACVRPLTRAQENLIRRDEPVGLAADATVPCFAGRGRPDTGDSRRRAVLGWARSTAAGAGATVATALGALSGVGLLYSLRELHWLALGPSVPDALPLLQLAGFDGQPLARVIVAWVPAGVVLGVALIRFAAPRRVVLILVVGAVLLLFASDASYALARNLRLREVLLTRQPGIGPWIECLLLVAGSALPRVWRGAGRTASHGLPPAPSMISIPGA